MKVRIIKASKPTYWYADRVGEVFKVYKRLCNKRTDYLVSKTQRPECRHFIFTEDCEVVD